MIFSKGMMWQILLNLCFLSSVLGYAFFIDDNLMNELVNFYGKLFCIGFIDGLWLWFIYSNRTKDGSVERAQDI